MAYVQPSGIIDLFKGIRLDNRYMHTIYFANKTDRDNWFANKVTSGLHFEAQSYSRPTRETVKVQIAPDNALGVTYMRFKNRTKWFYAFVTSTEYVNENTTLIHYEIDVMQTWFMDSDNNADNILPCYVVREHDSNDTFGDNLEPEPVGSDVYDNTLLLSNPNVNQHFAEGYKIVVGTTQEPTQNGMLIQGIYVGSKIGFCDDAQTLKTVIASTLGNWDMQEQSAEITDLYMFPAHFCGYTSKDETYEITHPGNLSGYTPKNKKLFSYPYSYLTLTTFDGDSAMYRWEYFERNILSETVVFSLIANCSGGGIISMHPTAYNGYTGAYDSGVTMDNFPKLSYAIDAYQAWVASGGKSKTEIAQHFTELKGSMAVNQAIGNGVFNTANQLSNVLTAESGASMAKAGLGTAQTAMNSYYNIEQAKTNLEEARFKIAFEFKDAEYRPNTVVGKQCANLAVGKGYLGYHFYLTHIKLSELKRIDDFFSTYGYSTHKVKKPNLTGRTYWNFVKTESCAIAGDMPASSKSAIAKIFDGGIFLWHNGDQVGNFRQSVTNDTINNPIV